MSHRYRSEIQKNMCQSLLEVLERSCSEGLKKEKRKRKMSHRYRSEIQMNMCQSLLEVLERSCSEGLKKEKRKIK